MPMVLTSVTPSTLQTPPTSLKGTINDFRNRHGFHGLDITDWLGEWESFEHYVDSGDATIQQTWEADEQAVLANPKMALMAARGIKTFWSMACSTTSPENIIHIGYWRVNEPAADSDTRFRWLLADYFDSQLLRLISMSVTVRLASLIRLKRMTSASGPGCMKVCCLSSET